MALKVGHNRQPRRAAEARRRLQEDNNLNSNKEAQQASSQAKVEELNSNKVVAVVGRQAQKDSR